MTPAAPRLLALRLACLQRQDRQWLLAQLGRSEAVRVRELLADLEHGGLTRYPELLQEALAEAERSAVADAASQALQQLLSGLHKPAWRVIAIQGLTPAEQEIAHGSWFADNQSQYRQWLGKLEGHVVPAGWQRALRQWARGLS